MALCVEALSDGDRCTQKADDLTEARPANKDRTAMSAVWGDAVKTSHLIALQVLGYIQVRNLCIAVDSRNFPAHVHVVVF